VTVVGRPLSGCGTRDWRAQANGMTKCRICNVQIKDSDHHRMKHRTSVGHQAATRRFEENRKRHSEGGRRYG